jgi:hypothetical protein
MKHLIVAAGVLLALLSPAIAQSGPVSCPSSAIYDASTNGATKLVTGLSTRTITICGYQLFAGGTASVSLVSGTGTNCGSNQAAVTPAYPLVAQTGVADQSPVFRGLQVGRSLDLCIKTSAGVAVQGVVYYSQE